MRAASMGLMGLFVAFTIGCGPRGEEHNETPADTGAGDTAVQQQEDTSDDEVDAGADTSTGADTSDAHSDTDGPDFSDYTESRQALTSEESYFVTYTPTPDPIPLSELFELTVAVYESSDMQTSVSGADLSMKAEMPTHGHGMNTTPKISDNGDGTYKVEGMKFHMKSEPRHPWTMEIGVSKDGTSDVAMFQVIMKGN